MNAEHRPLFTNVQIYRSIADDAYRQMSADMDANVRPRPEGSDVVVKTFDPEQLSFKQAMASATSATMDSNMGCPKLVARFCTFTAGFWMRREYCLSI